MKSAKTGGMLEGYGVDPATFWKKNVATSVESGYDPSLAFLQGGF